VSAGAYDDTDDRSDADDFIVLHFCIMTGEFIATGSLGGAVSIWSLASGTSVSRR
jgi:hypothetical protein